MEDLDKLNNRLREALESALKSSQIIVAEGYADEILDNLENVHTKIMKDLA